MIYLPQVPYFQFIRFCCLLGTLFLISCCKSNDEDYAIVGLGEFIQDSRQIAQGKLAILQMQGAEIPELPSEYLEEYRDEIEEDDVLSIVIYQNKRDDLVDAIAHLNAGMGFRVVNRCICLPGLEELDVAGLTLLEARDKIQSAYCDQIQDINVHVSYKSRLRNKVEIIGGFRETLIPVDGKMRLYEILSKVLFKDYTDLFKSYVIRGDEKLPLDFCRLLNAGDMSQNIVMKGGDRVFLAPLYESTMVVMGEVKVPALLPLRCGTISLREALAESYGFTPASHLCRVQVIRGSLPCPKIYVFSWRKTLCLPNEDLLLIPGDTIYVSEKPLSQWNRFITQLLPTTRVCEQGVNIYNIAREVGVIKPAEQPVVVPQAPPVSLDPGE